MRSTTDGNLLANRQRHTNRPCDNVDKKYKETGETHKVNLELASDARQDDLCDLFNRLPSGR